MCLGGTWCRSCIAFTGNARLIQFIAVHSTWSQCFRVCTIPYSTLQILTAIHLVSDKPFPREQEKLAPTTSKHPLLPSDALMQRRSLSAVPMLTTVDENVCSSHLSMNELSLWMNWGCTYLRMTWCDRFLFVDRISLTMASSQVPPSGISFWAPIKGITNLKGILQLFFGWYLLLIGLSTSIFVQILYLIMSSASQRSLTTMTPRST